MVLKGHTKWLTSATFSADGSKIVTTSLDTTALVFDSRGNGPALGRFEHPAAVYAATFDPEGKRVATACADGKVRIYELGGGAPVELDAKGVALYRIAWSADGTRIAAATVASTIWVWSGISWPQTNAVRSSVLQTDMPAVALAFAERGNKLVAAVADRTYTWDLDIGVLEAALRDENRDCLSVSHRILYLNEARSDAVKLFHECEIAQRRGNLPEEPRASFNRNGLIVARLLVKPVDAEVEWDGALAIARDGLFELWGKTGDKKKVRVVKGALSVEVDVVIDEAGAKPAVIDLDLLSPSGAWGPKMPLEAGDGDFDALVPDNFQ